MADRGGADRGRPGRVVEIVATVLLAVSAVATAWGSYQASRWTGDQASSFSAATAARLESTRASDLANAQKQVDIALFIQWVDAYARDQPDLLDFYRARFRDEFEPAVDAWLATEPLKNEDAPLTPFAMPEYRVAAEQDAARLEAEAEVLAARARTDIQRATNYVLGVVLFAIALFFAGISTKLASVRLRATVVGIGSVVFLVALGWIATFPISVSI
jgi:TRAP-type C4-dicarboxylate transport system permease small subunit